MNPIIDANDLHKIYIRGTEEIHAVNGISLSIERGDFVAFIGPSGSGKTTLVNILGCLDNPSSGSFSIDGKTIVDAGKRLSERELTRIRRSLFGYIFQSFYLIPTLTVFENVTVPLSFYRTATTREEVNGILERLGLEKRLGHLPGQLSGGEMQRVAIARALVNKPGILLADEPTGNLDTKRSFEIGDILTAMNREEKLTVIMVTHNPDLARIANRVVELKDGNIV